MPLGLKNPFAKKPPDTPPEPDINELFARAAYIGLLNREPDPTGLANLLAALRSGGTSWAAALRSIVNSREFILSNEAPLVEQRALHKLHDTRAQLFREHIPAAGNVIDLGGAAEQFAEGTLFLLGYPHAPKELFIVDLPAETRYVPDGSAVQQRDVVAAERGTAVQYVYRSMSDLSFAADEWADLVVSGQSIEHVTEEDGDAVCREVFRVLKPGGHFCLDTPNARLTRLQSPDEFIHPEHKKEYMVPELREKLERHGFRIEKELGVSPMPVSVRAGRFIFDELAANSVLSDRPEESYVMFFDAVKP